MQVSKAIMGNNKVNLRELLAEARAIHLAMRRGALSYEKAKIMTQPYLDTINQEVRKLARQYGVRPKEIRFQDLSRGL